VGPDGQDQVPHTLHRLGVGNETNVYFKDPNVIDDIDADIAETINISKSPYMPPAKIMAL
jgi:hypothetical protein